MLKPKLIYFAHVADRIPSVASYCCPLPALIVKSAVAIALTIFPENRAISES